MGAFRQVLWVTLTDTMKYTLTDTFGDVYNMPDKFIAHAAVKNIRNDVSFFTHPFHNDQKLLVLNQECFRQ